MPAQRLVKDQAVNVSRFDVVGEDSEKTEFFIKHVGMAKEGGEIRTAGEAIPVAHMKPPLQQEGSIHAHVLGSANLSADEIQQIKVALDDVEGEYEAYQLRRNWLKQYVICPHVKPVYGKDGTVIYRRYSCAGLVIETYREADIDLVADEELPVVDEDILRQGYGDILQRLDNKKREYCGIDGNGPWPVLLPGYVIQSLNKSAEEIRARPYQSVRGDELFCRT